MLEGYSNVYPKKLNSILCYIVESSHQNLPRQSQLLGSHLPFAVEGRLELFWLISAELPVAPIDQDGIYKFLLFWNCNALKLPDYFGNPIIMCIERNKGVIKR